MERVLGSHERMLQGYLRVSTRILFRRHKVLGMPVGHASYFSQISDDT